MFFNNGVLTSNRNIARLIKRCDEVEVPFYAESARWGYRTPTTWAQEKTNALIRFATQTATFLTGLRGQGYYPVEAPEFNQNGGVFTNQFTLTMTAANPIYYTLDGSDPRAQGSGAVAGLLYTNAITLTNSAMVRARAMVTTNQWSAVHDALFVVSLPSQIRITELMYNPRAPTGPETNWWTRGDYEFVEVQNPGTGTASLAGLEFVDGIQFDCSYGAVPTLAPGERAVLVANRVAFTNRYPGFSARIIGQYDGNLDDGGEKLSLKDSFGSTPSSTVVPVDR